ncbi:MAG: polyphosphate kinase 2 family protein [Verrucomicrobiota bacterium]|nr:polyphosphate kinase 2 family protein [Verrucomicrobiota bacterium]
MNYADQFSVKEGAPIRLSEIDPNFTDANEDKKSARKKVRKLAEHLDELQFKLYAVQERSLLICLQAMDAGGKDGTIRCIGGAMNPQGCRVVPFKQPSAEESAHDFLWRVEKQTPQRGEVVIFNRSHYEDVLVVRVHDLVPKKVWSQRYAQINDFERRLAASGTQILKFFLHISKEEQLERYKDRLDDPARRWKISESDYSERERWSDYHAAYDDAINKCTTAAAPWFVIPANHKWFRNLAISSIVAETLERMKLATPKPTVDVRDIRRKYHAARAEAERTG